MKNLVVFLLATLLLSSCVTEKPITPTPDIPVVIPSEEPRESASYFGHIPPAFYSEEEFVEYALNFDSDTLIEGREWRDEHNIPAPTHYYRLKTLPPDTIFHYIHFVSSIFIAYDTQKDAIGEYLSIRQSSRCHLDCLRRCPPRCSSCPLCDGSCEIETGGFWTERLFPEESYIFEEEGLKYYIKKVSGDDYFLWAAEWYNADGYYMDAQFPYRFTAEEVLGYISDLERVEIR